VVPHSQRASVVRHVPSRTRRVLGRGMLTCGDQKDARIRSCMQSRATCIPCLVLLSSIIWSLVYGSTPENWLCAYATWAALFALPESCIPKPDPSLAIKTLRDVISRCNVRESRDILSKDIRVVMRLYGIVWRQNCGRGPGVVAACCAFGTA
jgi:hypothetical protein